MLMPCPWVKIHGLPELEKGWRQISGEGAPYVIANHNSKLDSLLITALLPTWLGPKMRSLIKEALFNEPLFGGICTAVGHFPVYFKGSAEGTFADTRILNTVSSFGPNSHALTLSDYQPATW